MTEQSSASQSGAATSGRTPGDKEHRSRVIHAEMRRLQRRLLEYGPMPRQKLGQTCGADRWREGTLEEAIDEGVRAGKLKRLPLDWIEATAFGQQDVHP